MPAARRVDAARAAALQGAAPAAVRGIRALFEIFAAASFQSIWYWVLHVVVWTLACYRTLGVPARHAAARPRDRPEIAARVDALAQLASARIGGIHDLARRAHRRGRRASSSPCSS